MLQSLTFKYDCLGDIPELCEEIMEEIAASCNIVVTDGSATFRISWAGYGTGGLDVVVDCNPPSKNTSRDTPFSTIVLWIFVLK